MRRRSTLLLTIPALGAVVLAGCGSAADEAEVDTVPTGDLVPIVARAAAETGAATTGRFTMTVSFDAEPLGEMEMTAAGAYDEPAGRATLTVDMGSMFGGLTDSLGDLGDLGDLGAGADELGAAFGGEWTVVVDGDTTYLDMGGLGSMLGAGDGWVSVPTEADAAGSTPMGPVGAQEMLDVLAGVADVVEVGTEDVSGAETTHYEANVDVDALLERSAQEAQAQGVDPADLQAALDAFGEVGVEVGTIPVDVWVDGDGFVRRITMAVSMSGGLTGDVAYEMTAEYSGFGEAVDIVVPDPSEVTPMDPDALAEAGAEGLFGD